MQHFHIVIVNYFLTYFILKWLFFIPIGYDSNLTTKIKLIELWNCSTSNSDSREYSDCVQLLYVTQFVIIRMLHIRRNKKCFRHVIIYLLTNWLIDTIPFSVSLSLMTSNFYHLYLVFGGFISKAGRLSASTTAAATILLLKSTFL